MTRVDWHIGVEEDDVLQPVTNPLGGLADGMPGIAVPHEHNLMQVAAFNSPA